ncbi:MAG: hypothetical protein FWC14_05380 [Candidatus Bathyarchaeota archaeon]|uniref:hypothetical protein n=1 Tax=Candidatus Bathycorpusculum sp. TaxID=2994959 RepID=UPI0028354090|nr:hypothetical protein [Candidatus Termiticorpusculum sp.]MCL2292244.1 hypothetical protein [Candidatus Termiticorpusculum sp.]
MSVFVSGVANVTVSNQDSLRTAVVSAPVGLDVSYVIAIDADIYLTGSLVIPTNKNLYSISF